MITYTNALTLYQKLTADNSTTNTTIFDILYNEHIRNMLSKLPYYFLERNKTDLTEASVQFYPLPFNITKLIDVTVTVSSQKYTPKQSPTRQHWDRLNGTTITTSDIPEWFFVQNNELGFYPVPSNAGNTIRFNYRLRVKDVDTADYVTGDITNTNGDATIIGSGTTFTAEMADRKIKLGDENWYDISSFTDATNIELINEFDGLTASGVSFIIGDVSLIPEDYQLAPVYFTVADYWRKENQARSDRYEAKANSLVEQMEDMYGDKTDDPTIFIQGENQGLINPNLTVTK